MTRPNQGLSSLAPGGGKMRDPGNEVDLRFVCKEIVLNELNLLFIAHYFSSLFFNDKRQTCLRDGTTSKAVLCTKFCPACDKQVIASALLQLRINFTCIFNLRLGQFFENFENTREINP